MVKELVYQAAMRARVAPSTPCVSARSPGMYMPDMAMPANARESERREQAVAQPHAEAGQRAEDARGEIQSPGGPPVGQADERDDGEHIASGGDPREPAGLRVCQRPGLDELRAGEPERSRIRPGRGFRRRIWRQRQVPTVQLWRIERVTVPTRKPRLGGTGVLGVRRSSRGNCDQSPHHRKHRIGSAVHTRCAISTTLSDEVIQPDAGPEPGTPA